MTREEQPLFDLRRSLRRLIGHVLQPKVVRQFDEIDCGPAALLTILKYYRGDETLSRVRDLAGTDSRGTSLLGLAKAAQILGLRAEGVSGEYDDLAKAPMPCIAHFTFEDGLEHYVVVFGIGRRAVEIGDPGRGAHRMSRGEFERKWVSKTVLLVEPSAPVTANKSRSPLAWLRGNFVGSEAWLVQSVFAGLVYALLGIATSLCIQVLIDRLIPAHEVGRLISLGWLLVVLTLARSAVGLLRQHFLVEVGLRVNKQVAEGFLSRAFRLPMRFFDTRTKGDIASRLHDATKIQTAITRVLGTSVTDIFIIAGALLYIALFASALVPLALTCVFVYTAVMAVATRSLKAEQRLVMQSSAVLEGAYVDSLNGIAEIRAYSVPRLFEHLTQRLFQDVQGRSKSFALTQARASLCAEAVGGLLVLVALIYGAILVSSGEMQLGQMIAAYSLLASTVSPLTRLVDAHIAVQGASLAAVRLTDLAEAEEETSSGDRKFALQTGIEVQRLRFSWPRGDVLFADLSLEIPCGRITGMWGLSGSGKSTLVRILQRMYAPVSGQILVDGIPATAIELTLYRRGVAVVSASTKIFNMTLEENILLGRHEPGGGGPAPIPADRLANLIRDTGLTPFFERFPAGLSSEIGERGRTLSSGERQVVGLLRALVSSPSLLLIDEGLNALDADVSRVVWQALKLYAKQHAILLIAHDLNVLLETDFIYVLENGSITEEGPADALLGESGRLSQLWSARGCKRAALPSASRSFSMVPSRQSI